MWLFWTRQTQIHKYETANFDNISIVDFAYEIPNTEITVMAGEKPQGSNSPAVIGNVWKSAFRLKM